MIGSRKPKYVREYRDRHGKWRVYYHRTGAPDVPLPGPIHSEGFWASYRKAEADFEAGRLAKAAEPKPEIGEDRTIPGSFSELLARYYRAPEFLGLAETSRNVYRRQLEHFREKYGHLSVKGFQRKHLKSLMGTMEDRKSAANNLLKRLKVLLNFAADIGMVDHNPAIGMKGFKVQTVGFHAWTDEEIGKFEAKHPVGSRARLAMGLMLYTGQRRSDAVRMGWADVEGDAIRVRQQKTGTPLLLPLHPELKRLIADLPKDAPTFLLTEARKPFSAAGFGNWMREVCDEAELPDCSSHGLRGATATRLAMIGCTNQQIRAVTGHKSDAALAPYLRGVEQKRLAQQAFRAMTEDEAETEVANPERRLAKSRG